MAERGDGAACDARAAPDRPHVRLHQAGAPLRLVHGGDTEALERGDDARVGAMDVADDGVVHGSIIPS
jgi:hypothetical protein